MFSQILYTVYEFYCSYLSLNWIKMISAFCQNYTFNVKYFS